MLSIDQLHSHTCAELVGMCKELGLPHSGRRKLLLVQALYEYQRNNGGIPPPVLARNSFRGAAARSQQQQAMLLQQQEPCAQLVQHIPARALPANGSAAASVSFLLQKQMHALGCAGAGQASGGGLCGSGGPGFPSPPPGVVAAGGGVTSHVATGHAASNTATAVGAPTTSSSAGGGTGQGVFGRCLCKGATGGSRGRGSHAKSLKCKTCGNLSHMSCYPGVVGAAAQKFVCSTCRMKRLDPFYPVEEVLWETRLEGSHYTVDICAHALRKWRAEGKEVIVRCMQVDQPVLYQTWPKSIQISINGRMEETVSAPSWEHKRRDTPIVITQYLKNGKNRVEFWWTNYEEAKPFHLALLLCAYSSPEALAKTLELRSHVGEAEARRRVLSIVTNKNGSPTAQQDDEDDDVTCMEVTRRIKLLCPITFTRIGLPCRGVNCMHLQCFDLSGYLLVTRNTKAFNTRWKCPECQLYVRPDELVIDDFVLQILKDTPEDATVIELEADGSYRVVSEQELKEESKRAEAQRLRAAGACRVKRAIDEETSSASPSAPTTQPEEGPSKKAFEIVEMLSSSEDEEDALAIESNSSAPTAGSAMDNTTGAVTATSVSTFQRVVAATAPAATPASTLRGEGDQAAAVPLEASTTRALPPALVSSLRSAAAAASAAAGGGLLFSPASTAATQQQQQQQESDTAPTRGDGYACSPEEEGEEQEDDEDSALRVGRFHKRPRRTALSPASSASSLAPVGSPASSLQRDQQHEIVPGGSVNEDIPGATADSVGKRISARAGVRAAAESSARVVFPKTQALAAAQFAPAFSKDLEDQQQLSTEGGDIVVISSDDEEDLVTPAWTPVVTPQQQRRQQRRQQEQERRRLQEEKREEHRKLVAQAAAAAEQHARAEEILSKGTGVVGAGTNDKQNISFSDIATLALLSPPAATASGKQTLLSNLQLNFPSAPQRAATARSVSKDSESEVRGDEAAELLQLLLERQRQELEPRENLQMQEFEQHQQRLNLRTLTSLSSEKESICHRDAPPFWQAHDRPGDSSRSSASEEKASSNSDSGNSAWSCREIATAGRGRQPYDGNNTQTVTALPDSDSPAADGSSEAAGIINADALPPRDASTHRVSAAESRGFKQGPTRLHAGTDDTLFAHDSLSAASFPEVIPPSSYPRAASPPTPHASRETAGEVVVAAPSAGPGSVGESSGFGVPAACLAPAGNYYYVDIASINMTSPSVLQQEQIFQQPAQQQVVQQPLPCGGTGDGSSPVYGVDHSTIAESSLILQTYSKAAQHAQPQQTLDHLQQQAQQVMHQNLQPQQHAEEQQSVRQQQQVAHQQAAQHLHGLQQRYELPSSHQTAEAARAAGEQVTRGETRTTDTREKEQTRSFTVRVTAGDSEKKITGYRSRRSSARGIVSRSSSPDPGRREKRNEECTRESLQQLHPAAERAPVEATSLKADTAFAPASDRVELGPSSSGRSDADSREEPPHEQQQQHRQHQQKQQRQQPPLGTTDPVVGAGDISGSHAAPPSQAADSAAGARAAAAASAADATSSVSHFVQSTAATAAPPACAVSHQQASSAAGDRKRVAADEASLTAPNAEGAHLTMSKGLERAKSLTAKGTQGATGARRGPRMSLPPRSCVAALRSDAAVTSKPAASVEHGKVAFSAAVSATVSSTPSTIPIPSSVPTTRAGPAPSTAFWGSQGHRSGLSRGTAGVAAAPSAISSVARSADGAAAAASLVRAAAAGSTAAGTGLPRSPGRRLLVPPVPPPLPSRSIKHAGGASSSGQEECNSSGCTQHGPAGSFVNPSSETSSSSSQKDPRRKQSSCPPDTAAGAAIAAAASSAVGATHAVATSATVPSSPGLRSPSDDATAAAPVCREADPGVRTIGRLATHTGENSGAPSLTCWSIHRNVNTDVGRNTGTFFDVAPCGGGLNRQRSDNADRQHESSSDNNGSSGLTCSSARRHSIEEVERLSSDVSDSPTAAGGGGIPASAVSSLRRFRIELRRHSKTRMKDDGDHTEFSHSGRDVNVSECRTNSCSRRQSGSVATNFSECSASSSTTGGNDRRNLHEMKGAVSCCTSIEVSDREQEDLLRRPPANEREFSAVHQAAQACAGSSRLMRRERIAGMTGSEAGLGTSGGESRRQKAGVADNTETAERQRTDSAIGATAADEAPLVPGQREGGRCRVSVVLSHHAASHVKPPPSAFFCTANSVTPSPSASDSPVLAGQTDSDEAHTATGASRNICNRETAQSRLRAQQTGDRADSPCLNALGLYAPALSADFHASSSRRLTEGELVEGLDAGGHATVARTWIPADGSHAESVPFTGVSAPTLDSFPPESEWKATFLNDSCSDAGGAFPLSLHAVADRPTEASRIEQTQPCFQSEAEELGQQLVPIRCSEAQGAERQHSEIRSGDAEGKTLTRSEHKENLFLGTPLLHTSSQLQPRAHRVLKWQQDTRSATPHVDVESVTCFAETAKAGQWKTDEKAGAETKGYVCSEGIAWEGFEEAAAGHQEIPWEGEAHFRGEGSKETLSCEGLTGATRWGSRRRQRFRRT